MFHSPKEIAENYLTIGCSKARLSTGKLLGLSFLAGMFIALAAVGANTASCMIENPSLAKLVAGLVFPVGLAMVLLAGSELFTGDCLIILPVLEGRVKMWEMARCLLLVYLGNFAGGLLVAWAMNTGGQLNLFSGALGALTIKTAAAKCSLDFMGAFWMGVFCNFLVCISVWMSFSGKTATDKMMAMYLPILLFVVCGFEHCVANMYYIPAGLFAMGNEQYLALALQNGVDISGLTWRGMLVNNLLPVTLGNIVGGSGLVGALYWGIYLKKARPQPAVMDREEESHGSESSQKSVAKAGQ